MKKFDSKAYKSIEVKDLDIPVMHRILLSAVAPRPIAFASTINSRGEVNLSPFSFFNVFSANPPLLIFSPARRVRDNTLKHTLENVRQVPEVVVNIVSYDMVEQMSLSSIEYEKGINEFVKAGLTEIASDKVAPPRVGEAPVAFECMVENIIETGKEGGSGNLVICRVLVVHAKNEMLDQEGIPDPLKLDQVGRMGGNWYCRAVPDNMFEIPKPVGRKGIGVDSLPASVYESYVLSGNNLGRLGNMEYIPDPLQVETLQLELEKEGMIPPGKKITLEMGHRLVKLFLEAGNTDKALVMLWLTEQLREQ